MEKDYTTVKIRKDICATIDKIIREKKNLFYRNRTDYLHDALRQHTKFILEGNQ